MPTWENDVMYNQAKQSLIHNTSKDLRFYKFKDNTINKGWIGSCNEGIKASLNSDADYVLLTNDDILASPTSDWANVMSNIMGKYEKIGALGPLSDKAMGRSKLDSNTASMGKVEFFRVPFISFFFILLRKSMIREIGTLDESLPGGDDLDYSFRINDAGYMTCVTPKVYIKHECSVTGKKLYGNYWNSSEYTEKINHALIRKHGFKRYVYGMMGYEEKENGK